MQWVYMFFVDPAKDTYIYIYTYMINMLFPLGFPLNHTLKNDTPTKRYVHSSLAYAGCPRLKESTILNPNSGVFFSLFFWTVLRC